MGAIPSLPPPTPRSRRTPLPALAYGGGQSRSVSPLRPQLRHFRCSACGLERAIHRKDNPIDDYYSYYTTAYPGEEEIEEIY